MDTPNTPQEVLAHIKARAEEIAALSELWVSSFLPDIPDGQLSIWLDLHKLSTVVYGIQKTANKCCRLCGQMDADYAVRFDSSVMNTKKQEELRSLHNSAVEPTG